MLDRFDLPFDSCKEKLYKIDTGATKLAKERGMHLILVEKPKSYN